MFEKIAAYLSRQMDVPVESITEDTTFESLGIDSLDTVEMLMDLEQELNIDLELEEKLSTVGEFVAFVEERVG
jgi:acyl carrier protein